MDLQRLKVRPHLPALHRQLIGRFLDYVPGNHDLDFRQLAGRSICGIEVALEKSHTCIDGTRLLCIHGDCLDSRVNRGTYAEHRRVSLARVGRRAAQQASTPPWRDYSSLSAKIKLRLNSANEYIRRYEETAARYALPRGFDGIVCVHIHRAIVRSIDGMWYANTGDWVGHRSALVESSGGQVTLLHWAAGSVVAETRAIVQPVAA